MKMTRPPEDPAWRQGRTGKTGGNKPVDWSPKWLRECLCAQQTNAPDEFTREEIGRLIRLLDLHRPIGNDGKHGATGGHGDLHTPTCGCDQ